MRSQMRPVGYKYIDPLPSVPDVNQWGRQNMESQVGLRSVESQLREELRAQQAVCKKLMREREEFLQAIDEAAERIRMLEEELDLRDQMFQEYRESKERDIGELTRIKQDLEVRLQAALDSQDSNPVLLDPSTNMKGLLESEPWSLASGLPQLSASEIVDTLGKWEGMEDTLALFQEKNLLVWTPGAPWNSPWKFTIRIYICCHGDTHIAVETFMKECLPSLVHQCTTGGCCILPIHLTSRQPSLEEEELLSLCSHEVEQSDIFVCILKASADRVTKAEIERGYINNPSARRAVFLFLPEDSSATAASRQTGSAQKLKQRVKNTGRNAKIIECDEARGIPLMAEELQRVLREEFGVMEAVQGDSDAMLERIALVEDMRAEWEQTEVLRSLLSQAPSLSLTEMDELFAIDRLESYLHEEGPVAPILITSQPGCGKSTLMAYWIKRLESHYGDSVLVLYHFVRFLCSSSAEPALIMRRLTQKLMYSCTGAGGGQLPSHPLQLGECFTSWLEKLSSNLDDPREKAIIIIDNADLILDHEQHMGWFLKPLPNKIRVVLTASEDNYPDSWRVLPSPSLPTPTQADMQVVIHQVQRNCSGKTLDEGQVRMLAAAAPPVPLWGVLATRHILCLPALSSSKVDEVVELFEESEEVPDLVQHILGEVEANNEYLAESMGQLLQLVYWSRNGLLLTELQELTAFPQPVLASVVHQLQKRAILLDRGGLIHITHEQVQDGVQLKYCTNPSTDYMLLWSNSLISYFSSVSEPGCLMSRCMEELPWLLKRAEWREELYHTLMKLDMLIQLYASGHCGELFCYWKFLDPSPSVMATQYYKSLREMEEGDSNLSPAYVSSLFGTVGKILRNLGLLEEALPSLQHSLELHEAHFDPDGPEVATAMCELATLYTHTGKVKLAEGYYKQALQMFESAYGEESPQVLKALESLKNLDSEEVGDTMARIYAIKQSLNNKASASGVLKSHAMGLEQYCTAHSELDSLECAGKLNELAVIYSVYGDSDVAEELFMKSLKMYETLVGENHLTLQPLKNLGTFYMQRNRFEWATSLYEKAHEVSLQNYPPAHPAVTDSISRLSLVYRQQGRLDAAEPLQKQLIELKEKENGPNHQSVAKAINNLAVIYCLQSAYDKAVPLYDRALKIYEQHLSADHPTVLQAINNRQLALSFL